MHFLTVYFRPTQCPDSFIIPAPLRIHYPSACTPITIHIFVVAVEFVAKWPWLEKVNAISWAIRFVLREHKCAQKRLLLLQPWLPLLPLDDQLVKITTIMAFQNSSIIFYILLCWLISLWAPVWISQAAPKCCHLARNVSHTVFVCVCLYVCVYGATLVRWKWAKSVKKWQFQLWHWFSTAFLPCRSV